MAGGRVAGSGKAGGLSAWLHQAQLGDVYWTERRMQGMTTEIKRSGRTVSIKRFYAVSDGLVAVALVRVEVTQ